MASSQLLSANCGFIAIALCESRFSSRSLSANHGFIAVALSESRYRRDRSCDSRHPCDRSRKSPGIHRDRSQRIAASARSLSRIAGIIAIALGESRIHRDRSRDSRHRRDRSCDSRHPCDRSRESPGIHRDRSQRIAVSSRSLSANRGIRAIALANRRVLRESGGDVFEDNGG